MTKKVLKSIFVFIIFLIALSGCTNDDSENQTPEPQENNEAEELEALFGTTFRIDIQSINVEFDYTPEEYQVKGRATVRFRMRSGQKTPLIHFNPGARDINSIKTVKLNDQQLNIETDIKVITFENTTQQALEFQKELSANDTHTLYMEYDLALDRENQIFKTDVNDISGVGNEELFPTINSPQELATHEIKFRNMSNQTLKLIGSGNLTEIADSPTQEWILKPEKQISSYTFMFLLVPESEIDYQELVINGVNVKIMAYRKNSGFIETAIPIIERCLPDFEKNIGPFPMTEGLSLFIRRKYGGMEYYGGSITSTEKLAHEIFHMYFGCSVVNKTYRDSWLDESINVWYEDASSPEQFHEPINEDYKSSIVSNRAPVALGFDLRAYGEGARIIAAMVSRMGGTKTENRDKMFNFLKHLYNSYQFKPFTTRDFVKYFKDYTGIDMTKEFEQWVFGEKEPGYLNYETDHMKKY